MPSWVLSPTAPGSKGVVYPALPISFPVSRDDLYDTGYNTPSCTIYERVIDSQASLRTTPDIETRIK